MSASYDRIRVLWPDHLGLARGKYVPSRLVDRGARHCTGTWALGFDRNMTPGTPGSMFFEGLPDMDAVFDPITMRPGWEPNTGIVIADLMRHGEPVAVSPRHALRRAIEELNGLGYHPKVGLELEAYLLQPDGNGGWTPISTPGAYVYGTGTSVDPSGMIDELWATAEAAGLPVEAINSEYDESQFEFTLEYDWALKAADDAFLFKLLAREVAAKRGLMWTFMGKPFTERGGSGLHLNISFADEAERNLFDDPSQDDGLAVIAKQAVAGMIAHHQGLAGICAPTVNAYRRLRPGQLSGYWANWGYDHRGATIRIPPERGGPTRLEHRLSDGAAPVHSAMAAVLQACRLGIVNEMDPGKPESGDGFENVDASVGTPAHLGAALDALEADQELVNAIGAELVAQHTAIKRTEWEKFLGVTTDWERDEYLPFL